MIDDLDKFKKYSQHNLEKGELHMSIYTKKGDGGKTSLMNGVSISKSDDRIELVGTIDELNSAIGLAKVLADDAGKEKLSLVQRELMQIMAGIADPGKRDYRISEAQIQNLEQQIDHMESSFPRAKEFVLYGGCELSARLDMARAIARRAERRFQKVSQFYGVDPKALQYVNRLSDYLYVTARYVDHLASSNREEGLRQDVIRSVMKNI